MTALTLLRGDCLVVMAGLPEASIDAVVTDPPYGIGFMGHEWDQVDVPTRKDSAGRRMSSFGGEPHPAMEVGRYDRGAQANREYQRWCQRWGEAAIRVAKPGAHLLSFGSTRTMHRQIAGLEDAGWEIRDTLVWAYAEGYPKNLNIGRSIDQSLCVLPGRHRMSNVAEPGSPKWREGDHLCPTTPQGDAHRHEGTALKPAWEPIALARRPIPGTIAESLLSLGTGALNIEGARLPVNATDAATWTSGGGYLKPGSAYKHGQSADFGQGLDVNVGADPSKGRWPSNLMLTDPIFDGDYEEVEGGGQQASGKMLPTLAKGERTVLNRSSPYTTMETYGDSGGYSRFFMVPKSAMSEREPVIAGQIVKAKPPGWSSGEQSPGTFQSRPTPERENTHPTVKPLDLMRYLVRLVTPRGGTVLDPFLGSGTTALAAEQEGFSCTGIEREAKYMELAEARLNGTQRGLGL